MLKIKEIGASDTLSLRHSILRKGQPLSTCYYPNDNQPTSFHLGGFIHQKLVVIGSFYHESHAELDSNHAFRFRGIATQPDHRRKGYAFELIEYAFDRIKATKGEWVWCNARTSALGLYYKLNMIPLLEPFDLPNIGPHQLMIKKL